MSDLDKVKALMQELGVGFTEGKNSTNATLAPGGLHLEFRAKEHSKVEGYNGFEMNMYFREDGTFVIMDIYE